MRLRCTTLLLYMVAVLFVLFVLLFRGYVCCHLVYILIFRLCICVDFGSLTLDTKFWFWFMLFCGWIRVFICSLACLLVRFSLCFYLFASFLYCDRNRIFVWVFLFFGFTFFFGCYVFWLGLVDWFNASFGNCGVPLLSFIMLSFVIIVRSLGVCVVWMCFSKISSVVCCCCFFKLAPSYTARSCLSEARAGRSNLKVYFFIYFYTVSYSVRFRSIYPLLFRSMLFGISLYLLLYPVLPNGKHKFINI